MNITIPKLPEKTLALPSGRDIAKGIALIALARAQLPGMHPLGLAWAATFPAERAYAALIALCVGMADARLEAIKYIIAFFFYYILVNVRRAEDSSVKAIALGAAAAAAGALSLFWTGAEKTEALLLLPEAVITGCAYRLFAHADEKSDAGNFAVLILLGGILNGIRSVNIPYINFSPAVFTAFFAVMSLSYACTMPAAVFSAAVLGFVMYMDGQQTIAMTGAFAVCAVFSALLSGMGKAGAAVGLLCGITVSALYAGSLGGIRLADIFLPVGVFILLPEALHYRISDAVARRTEPEEIPGANIKIAAQLKTVAKAVNDLAEGVTFLSDKNRESAAMKEMFDTIAGRVCRGCSLESSCWRKDSRKTYGNMYELWSTMETDGYCDHTNMPLAFRQVCMRSESFLCEFNHVYELYKQNAISHGEALSERDIIARQYSQISNVIGMLSREVERGAAEDENHSVQFCVSVNAAQEPKSGQAVCGDTLVHFERDGRYFIILCDGMGSGESALSESRLTARLFAEFLKAGFAKETAVNMINSALALKADKESFSTVDLLEIDLETGNAEFLKIGSAQSFIKTRSNIEVISSKALPIGILDNLDVSAQERQLTNGDVVLMVSDGAGEAGSGVLKNDWIKKLMMMENRNDDELARLILTGAKSRMKFSDDITSVVVRIGKV